MMPMTTTLEKPKIEIVSHCLADIYPHYADLLCYQLSSLILDRPRLCDVTVTICYLYADTQTEAVLDLFSKYTNSELHLNPIEFGWRDYLGRRSIGRNKAAMYSDADIVWFSDVDQCYRDGILDQLAKMEWPKEAAMIYPRDIKIHKDHTTGDRAAKLVDGKPRIMGINYTNFIPKHYTRAIGGVQIVRGDFAREHGYLNGIDKWQQPANKPFGDFRDDIAYRKFCQEHGGVRGVDLPGVYRLRHSTNSYEQKETVT